MIQDISKVPDHIAPCLTWELDAEKGIPNYDFLGQFIQAHAKAEKLHGTALAYAIYLGERYWTKVSVEVGGGFGFDYNKWACHWSGKTDVSSYKRVGEFLENMRTGLVVIPNEVVLYNEKEEVVVDEESRRPVYINPDVFSPDINYTKLLISKSKAENTGLTDQDWGMLFNPDVTVEQYRQHLLGGEGYGWEDDSGRLRCWQEGPMILCSERGRTVEYVGIDGLNIEGLELGDSILTKIHVKVCKTLGMRNVYEGDF